MRRMLLIGGLAAALSLLSGCMIIDCDEPCPPGPPCVIYEPPYVVEVVPVPPPRPYWHGYYYHHGRRW